MVKNVLTLLLLGAVGLCHAQTLISPGGATVANASMSISYAIGEIAISTLSDAQVAYTQGFLQPQEAETHVDVCIPGVTNVVVLFPNPVGDEIFIKAQFNCFLQYNILKGGRIVRTGTYEGTSINANGLIPGIYFLHLIAKEHQFSQIIKFIKK